MIRAATIDDLSAVQRIADEAFEPFVTVIGKKPAPMVADFAKQLGDSVVFVAEEEGDVIGYCVSYPRENGWHVENLAVAASAQGKGIGKSLMVNAESRAFAAGFAVVDLYTNIAMTGALALYPQIGYDEVNRAEEDGFKRAYFRKALT